MSSSAILNESLHQITSQLLVDAADILLYNPNIQMLEYVAGRGFETEQDWQNPIGMNAGRLEQVAINHRLLVIDQLSQAEDDRLTGLAAREGFTAYRGLPLLVNGRFKGVLEVFQRVSLERNENWLASLGMLAGQLAMTIDTEDMIAMFQPSNADLEQAYEATIDGWIGVLDLHQKAGLGHSFGVTMMTLRLAEAMGMGAEQLVQIRRGSLLHDIGMVAIPDYILFKPQPLSEEEWQIMRQHPLYANDLLSSIEFLQPALDIPYCHHEKWDGTGYPRGLKGKEIPLAARIFAVVDVWDALLTDRVYRKAWPKEWVRKYIQEQAGKHFDPEVVEIFLSLVQRQGLGEISG